jgi:large subunit ribosomal protein L4
VELKILNTKKKIDLVDDVFNYEFNEALIHQVVVAYLAGGRAGTKAQKTRAEVRGGGAKPWKQKGGGRARAGTIRSPIWRKGGVVFAAKPRSFKQKVNKKMFNGALRSILSELIRQERFHVVESLQVDSPKTKALLNQLKEMKIEGNILIITDSLDKNLYLSARNLPNVEILDASASASNPVALINAEKVVITLNAVKELEESLK